MHISYSLAFAAGLLSFLSPCVFPLVPAYAAYLGGRAALPELTAGGGAALAPAGPRSLAVPLVGNGMAFVAGFSTVFIALFYVFKVLEFNLSASGQRTVNFVAGAFVVVLAIQTMGLIRIPWLMRDLRIHDTPKHPGSVPSFLLGLTFAAGWTPCIGPELGAILTVAQNGSVGGLPFMVVYCLGLGVPFLAVAVLADRLQTQIRGFNRHLGIINLVAGGLLLVFGLLILTNQLTYLARFSFQSPFDI